MVPETERQLFRRFEPAYARSEPLAVNPADSAACSPETRWTVHEPPGACCAVPWSNRTGTQPFAWQELRGESPLRNISILLGKATRARCDLQAAAGGAIVVLDRATEDPVEIVVDGRVVALGRLVVARDNKLAVEIFQVRRTVRGQAA